MIPLGWSLGLSALLFAIGVVGVLFPGNAAEQMVGGDDTWVYSMLYGSYSW